jgi:hypothetical protein
MAKYYDDDVKIAMEELKNTKANKKLAKMKSDDFVLYTDTADDFDLSELGGNFGSGVGGFSDDSWN